MTKKAKAIPEGHHSVTPYLVVKGADRAIEFYKKAFGAQEVHRMPGPEGKIMHAEIRIGDSIVMLADEFPDMKSPSPASLGGTPVRLMLYVPDVDATFKQALQAGAKSEMEPKDMFWGDRYGKVLDPFGHRWDLGTHKEDLSPEEIGRRQHEFFAKVAGKR